MVSIMKDIKFQDYELWSKVSSKYLVGNVSLFSNLEYIIGQFISK